MLCASLHSSRRLAYKPNVVLAERQWLAIQARWATANGQRSFADATKPSITNSKPVVLPGSASPATSEPLPPGPVATTPSSTAPTPATPSSTSFIPTEKIPLSPPTPPLSLPHKTVPSPAPSQPPPSPPPPQPKPRRILRRIFLTLLALTVGGFAGGVYYSRVNDNFHDFFTEYIPFGEEAVLNLEEREFRRKYASRPRPQCLRDTGDQVKIPSQSGVSWRVADENGSGRRSSSSKGESSKPGEAAHSPSLTKPEEKVKQVEKAKTDASDSTTKPPPGAKSPEPAKSHPESTPASETKPAHPVVKELEKRKESGSTSFKAPEVDEPSRLPPKITRVDPINIEDAKGPVVQDLVKIMNDIITVVNADNSNARFSRTIEKAKDELSKVGTKIKALKDAAEKDADQKVKAAHEDFDRGAKQLIQRIQVELETHEAAFKQEYEDERKKIHENYEQKLKSEIEQTNKVNEQRTRNELLEQAIEMKRKFTSEIKAQVEQERNGRLSKLLDLTNTVTELEKLTTDWNPVVDENLKTQHLHVAVEAVRAKLEKTEVPRPFVRELAALKEIASDDPVVNAAIASINPTAYQRGIPSSGQLIDRFRRVATEVRKASLLPEEAGIASHVSSFVLSKLLFKKKGLATGDDVESILMRTEMLLEEGDLDAAAREMNGLNGWAKTLSRDWLGEVRKVLEVQQALDVIAIEARLQSLRVE